MDQKSIERTHHAVSTISFSSLVRTIALSVLFGLSVWGCYTLTAYTLTNRSMSLYCTFYDLQNLTISAVSTSQQCCDRGSRGFCVRSCYVGVVKFGSSCQVVTAVNGDSPSMVHAIFETIEIRIGQRYAVFVSRDDDTDFLLSP